MVEASTDVKEKSAKPAEKKSGKKKRKLRIRFGPAETFFHWLVGLDLRLHLDYQVYFLRAFFFLVFYLNLHQFSRQVVLVTTL